MGLNSGFKGLNIILCMVLNASNMNDVNDWDAKHTRDTIL